MAREACVLDSYFAEVDAVRGADARLDAASDALRTELADPIEMEHRARRVVEHMALVFTGALVVKQSPTYVVDAFCASRLARDSGNAYGTLPRGIDTRAIVNRAAPTA